MTETIHFEIAAEDRWVDVAELVFHRPDDPVRSPCTLHYDFDYAFDFMATEASAATMMYRSVTSTAPVDVMPRSWDRWPAFLDDIAPNGAARRWWLRRLGVDGRDGEAHDLSLLRHGAVAPVGSVRVREAQPEKRSNPVVFKRRDVIERDTDFLEYAASVGAAVGGATGAGGDAPKLLVQVDGDDVWIPSGEHPVEPRGQGYLVKFARNRRSREDHDVLRTEALYYRCLAELGVETVDVARMRLEEGSREPSLWLPRFDEYRPVQGSPIRLGLESLYAMLDRRPGSVLEHEQCLAALCRTLGAQEGFDVAALVVGYLERDLLNLAFGNSDNHGRNTAILKTPTGSRLAPVYDFAPMRLDPEMVIRSTKWAGGEGRGRVDWPRVAEAVARWVDPDEAWTALSRLASRLVDLPDRLIALGLPARIIEHPRLRLDTTRERLERWGLL